jgi:tetratricopeptide (TPR) repeat protein
VTSGNYVAHYNLGAVLWEQGKRTEAMEHFSAAAHIREPYLRYQLAAAEAAVARGALSEAIPRMTRVLMIVPFNADLHHRLGTWLALNREPGKALMEFSNALKYRPDWTAPRVAIAAVLLGEGEGPKAEKILSEVLAREPDLAEARELLEKARARQTAAP